MHTWDCGHRAYGYGQAVATGDGRTICRECAAREGVAPFGPLTTALYGTQDIRGFFERAAESLRACERDTTPGAHCDTDGDEHPREHVSVPRVPPGAGS